MERPEGYPEEVAVTPSKTRPSLLGAKNDMSLLESGLFRRSYSNTGKDYYRFQSKAGHSSVVDPRLLALLEFFRELYFRRIDLFKKIFPGRHDEFLEEMPKKLGLVLSQVKSDQARGRTLQRSVSIGSPREFQTGDSELRLERFKVRTINFDDGADQAGQTSAGASK